MAAYGSIIGTTSRKLIILPNDKAWKSKDANADGILSHLFFAFPASDALRMRKIVRIIMSEMYFDLKIANYVITHLISGREKMLTDCFTALAVAGKIPPLDSDSAARCLNRLILAYAIEDTLRYPYIGHP